MPTKSQNLLDEIRGKPQQRRGFAPDPGSPDQYIYRQTPSPFSPATKPTPTPIVTTLEDLDLDALDRLLGIDAPSPAPSPPPATDDDHHPIGSRQLHSDPDRLTRIAESFAHPLLFDLVLSRVNLRRLFTAARQDTAKRPAAIIANRLRHHLGKVGVDRIISAMEFRPRDGVVHLHGIADVSPDQEDDFRTACKAFAGDRPRAVVLRRPDPARSYAGHAGLAGAVRYIVKDVHRALSAGWDDPVYVSHAARRAAKAPPPAPDPEGPDPEGPPQPVQGTLCESTAPAATSPAPTASDSPVSFPEPPTASSSHRPLMPAVPARLDPVHGPPDTS